MFDIHYSIGGMGYGNLGFARVYTLVDEDGPSDTLLSMPDNVFEGYVYKIT